MSLITTLRKICIFLSESGLVILTVGMIAVAAALALCIGYVLPRQMLDPEMVNYTHMPLLSKGVSKYMKALERLRNQGDIQDYTFIVSLSRQIYVDDPDSMEFMCIGNMISRTLVLTGIDCIRPLEVEKDFLKAQLRSNSSYFSKGGQLHEVTNFHRSPPSAARFPVYILGIFPHFSKDAKIPTLGQLFWRRPENLESVGFGGVMNSKHDLLKGSRFHFMLFQDKEPPGLNDIGLLNVDHQPVLLGLQSEMYLAKARLYFTLRKQVWTNWRAYKTDGRPLLTKWKNQVYMVGMRMMCLNPWGHPLKVDYHFQLFDYNLLAWIWYAFHIPYSNERPPTENTTRYYSWISSYEAKHSLERYMLVDNTD